MKLAETPEEKRARRLAKKERKAERKKAKLAQGGMDVAVGAEDSGRFVWHKKVESALDKGVSREELARLERERAEENQREIEAIKKRRAQAELDRKEREREKDMMLRAQGEAQFGQWADQEELFVMKQAQLRSELRLQAGRAKPIDLLAKYIHTPKDDPDIGQHEPYVVFDTITLDACEELKEDIKVYMRLEGHLPENRAFWEDIDIICDHTLKELYRQRARENTALSAAERRALDSGALVGTETETEAERQRQRDRGRERERQRQRETEKERKKERQRNRGEGERQRDRERQGEGERKKDADRQKETVRKKERCRQKERDRQRETACVAARIHTHTHTLSLSLCLCLEL